MLRRPNAQVPVPVSPPHVVSWNLTARCNLRCAHCYLDAGGREGGHGELDTERCLGVIDELASLNPAMLLILTGGEPLLRSDLDEIAAQATSRGMMVVVGTNGHLLDEARARRLMNAGVSGVGISLDSASPDAHDRLRGTPGSWKSARDAMRVARTVGLEVVVQTTVTNENREQLGDIAALALAEGARAFNLYFLVCTGRAREFSDLSAKDYERVCLEIRHLEQSYDGRLLISPKCAPHFRRVVVEHEGPSATTRGFEAGCPAGTDYLRIGPRGEVTPCPYLPMTIGTLATPTSATTAPLQHIWRDSSVLNDLRKRELGGNCGSCGLRTSCGGCRARALAASGDILAEDPTCTAPLSETIRLPKAPAAAATYGGPAKATMPWTADAQARLDRVPSALRAMVVARTEQAARSAKETAVTAERMRAVRGRVPSFVMRRFARRARPE